MSVIFFTKNKDKFLLRTYFLLTFFKMPYAKLVSFRIIKNDLHQ